MPTFIETQFPIARLSAEAYKERKANNSQTLTRLGKWWGRKPLILVRASILGMLMPASDDPKRDREIFLKILTMDDDGAWQRQKGDIPVAAWVEAAPLDIRQECFTARGWQRGLTDEEKEAITARIWESLDAAGRKALGDHRRRPVPDREAYDAMPYAERITHCERPENIAGPSPEAWEEINAHVERYYLRALDIESRGERRKGMYEELARGFGVTDIRPLLKSDQANGTRMHTPSGFSAVGLAQVGGEAPTEALPARRGRAATGGTHPFASTPLRHLLFAIRETTAADNSPEPGRQYLRDTFGQGYWGLRERFISLLEWLAALGNAEGMNEWPNDSAAARILAGRLRNDQA